MKLSELTKYVEDKYQIKENFDLTNYPNCSVLIHPKTQRWIALLIRQIDSKNNSEIERCDVRRIGYCFSYLYGRFSPFLLKGSEWVGFDLNSIKDNKEIFDIFDETYATETKRFEDIISMILYDKADDYNKKYIETLPQNKIIYEMQKLYCYDESFILDLFTKYDYSKYDIPYIFKCKNFYLQGKFMENYSDDVSLKKSLKKTYPTYHDLDTEQLRQFFSWRTKIRKYIFEKISNPFAHLYIFELLNLIGTDSVEDSLNKLIDFYENYANTKFGSLGLQNNMKEWILGFIVINNLSKEIALNFAPQIFAIEVLFNSKNYDDNTILSALGTIMERDISTLVIKKTEKIGNHYFAKIWSICFEKIQEIIFGKMQTMYYEPLPNVPYWTQFEQYNRVYELCKTHIYYYEDNQWNQKCYWLGYNGQENIKYFIHAVDLKLRQLLNIGSSLKEKRSDLLFFPFIDEAIEIIKEDLKPKIAINLAFLDNIRKESNDTRDNLLTEEDLTEDISGNPNVIAVSQNNMQIEIQILTKLLSGENINEIINENHLMPSVVADKINELFYDDFSDNIIDYNGITFSVIEDYKNDLIKKLIQ